MKSITFKVTLTDRRSNGDEVFVCRVEANEALVTDVTVTLSQAVFQQALKQTELEADETETAEDIANTLVLGSVLHAITPFVSDDFLTARRPATGLPKSLDIQIDAAAAPGDVFALIQDAIEKAVQGHASSSEAQT